jgi:hypothetical protein
MGVKGRWRWIVIGANLLVLVALAFVYPHLMVSPGPLRAEHAALATDCFACHAPLRGPMADRCIACHALADIGLRTTKGAPINANQAKPATPLKISFHQELTEPNCMGCHSDHAGPKLTQRTKKPFSHTLLRAATRDRCELCHAAPSNDIHRNLRVGCAQCHDSAAWKPARFDHATLPEAALNRCETCHQAPVDKLHRSIKGNCVQCHSPKVWKPATFDHDRLFLLDRAHNVDCIVCHIGGDVSRYTCYGCHEHTPANVREKHREEGIGNIGDCVRCHRSAAGEREGD